MSLALLVLGTAACAVAWVFLVQAAITFGHAARDRPSGNAMPWAFTAAATAGAAVCLLLFFVLGTRTLRLIGLAGRPHPRRSSGGRRSRRRADSTPEREPPQRL